MEIYNKTQGIAGNKQVEASLGVSSPSVGRHNEKVEPKKEQPVKAEAVPAGSASHEVEAAPKPVEAPPSPFAKFDLLLKRLFTGNKSRSIIFVSIAVFAVTLFLLLALMVILSGRPDVEGPNPFAPATPTPSTAEVELENRLEVLRNEVQNFDFEDQSIAPPVIEFDIEL